MDKIERLIKRYLSKNLDLDKSPDCPDEYLLLEYVGGSLDEGAVQGVEVHIASCGFCLSQLNLVSESKAAEFEPVSKELINKTKSALGIKKGGFKIRPYLYLAGAVFSFVLSFVIPKYFMQCLVVTLILGIRWAFGSEGGRTLIMVLDSWRHHSQDKDQEISHRLKR